MFKHILRLYLLGAIIVPTVAISYSFIWYRVEYYMAVDLYPSQKERAEIHRNNALWLGMWGGLYGIISTTATGFLLQDLRSTQLQSKVKQSTDDSQAVK